MKANLGCGDDIKDDFINLDIRKEVRPDILCDIRLLPIADDTFSYVYCKDVLEHFWEVEELLSEIARTIRGGGRIEAIVPDWHTLGDKEYWTDKSHEQIEKHIYGGHKNPYDQHHTIWTEKLATKRFYKAGFRDIDIEHLKDSPTHWHMKIIATKGES